MPNWLEFMWLVASVRIVGRRLLRGNQNETNNRHLSMDLEMVWGNLHLWTTRNTLGSSNYRLLILRNPLPDQRLSRHRKLSALQSTDDGLLDIRSLNDDS